MSNERKCGNSGAAPGGFKPEGVAFCILVEVEAQAVIMLQTSPPLKNSA